MSKNFLLHKFASDKSYDNARAAIKAWPKAELHLHFTGAVPLWYLESIADSDEMRKEYDALVQNLDVLASGVDYHDSFRYFSHAYKLLNTYKKIENGIIAIAKEQLDDNVVYVEVRSGLRDLGDGLEEYLRSLLRGIERCPPGIAVKLILSLRRDTPADVAQSIVDLAISYKDQGVVGIDVSGDSTVGDISNITPALRKAKEHGLGLSLHLGESFDEIDSKEKRAKQAEILEILQPDRIGHGVYLSRQSVNWLLQHPNIPIEVCPSSSVLTGMIPKHNEHPGFVYHLDDAHPIIICTDDPLLFQANLTDEYMQFLQQQGVTLEKIKHMISGAFNFTFVALFQNREINNPVNRLG